MSASATLLKAFRLRTYCLQSPAMRAESVVASLIAGLATGAHCAAMCGPMACAFRVVPVSYHFGRLLSYTLAGALCGLLGQAGKFWFKTALARIGPWTLLLVLVLMATGIERRLPFPRFLHRFASGVRLQTSLGILSPLIPCGPLWLMLGVATTTGGAADGAVLLLCFAAGTVLLYAPLLSGWVWFQCSCGPMWGNRLRLLLLWAAVGLMAWRLSKEPSHGCCRL